MARTKASSKATHDQEMVIRVKSTLKDRMGILKGPKDQESFIEISPFVSETGVQAVTKKMTCELMRPNGEKIWAGVEVMSSCPCYPEEINQTLDGLAVITEAFLEKEMRELLDGEAIKR